MASIRSISTAKPPERLLPRRSYRASASLTPMTPRRKTLTKTISGTSSTLSSLRQKTSRFSLRKDAVLSVALPAYPQAIDADLIAEGIALTTNQLASTSLHDVTRVRSASKASDTTEFSLPHVRSHTNSTVGEQHSDTDSTLVSYKSSLDHSLFTLESFEPIRTIGTGKSCVRSHKNDRSFCLRNLWSRSSRLRP